MGDAAITVTYFTEPGPQNTPQTLQAAYERATALGIGHVIVASDSGKTALAVLEVFRPPAQVIAVTNPSGTSLPISMLHEYLPRFKEHKEKLKRQGLEEITCSLAEATCKELAQIGARVSRVDWEELQSFVGVDLSTIDIIGVGTRVALCCSAWAYLAKMVPANKEVLALAGTGFGGGGADTALIIRTGATWKDWRVLETIVRPRESPPSELIS
jgi:uncharacterized protein